MAKRSQRTDAGTQDAVHREMLRHLEQHPPQAGVAPPAQRRGPKRAAAPAPARNLPKLMLRRLPLAGALEALRRFVDAQRALGAGEVLVIVGKGRHSPGGEAILRPQVEAWLRGHPQAVVSLEAAPARWGGDGAWLVRLRPLGGRDGKS